MRGFWRVLYRYPRVQLAALLGAPLGWLVIAYLGSLALLFISSFWSIEPFSGEIVTQPTLENFETIASQPVYRAVTIRTVLMAAIVTVTCIVLAFPIAYYMARVASPRTRGILVVSILLPLWSGYLVKAYAWRDHPQRGRDPQLDPRAGRPQGAGFRRCRGLDRVQLPVAALHDPAHLRRDWSASRARCSRRPVTSVPGPARRSAGSSCRWPCRRSSPARSSRSP